MRAGPLSNAQIISLLNAHFIPVSYSREDREAMGTATPQERDEISRVFAAGRQAELSVGTVHVYIITPQGDVIDSLHVAQAARTPELLQMLERAIARLQVEPGPTIVTPQRQSVPEPHEAGALILHLTSRNIRGAGWDDFPSESWIAIEKPEIAKLLPAGPVEPGTTWQVDPQIAARILMHVYPTTENNQVAPEKLERHELSGRVVHVENGVARARLDGAMRMKHNFYYRDDGKFVEAQLVGYLDFEPDSGRVRTVRMMTEQATYGTGTFGVTIEAVEPEVAEPEVPEPAVPQAAARRVGEVPQ